MNILVLEEIMGLLVVGECVRQKKHFLHIEMGVYSEEPIENNCGPASIFLP